MLIRHTVCRFFEEHGFDVHSASNGLEAWEMIQQINPDLVVTDLSMPKMTGTQLITAIKSLPKLAALPIVVLASRRTASDPQQMDTRADFVIHKDIDIEHQLLSVLSNVFDGAAGTPPSVEADALRPIHPSLQTL
jgi:CheY-like chemotaxis protein